MSEQKYTIKPLTWIVWPNRQHTRRDGSTETVTHYSSSSAVLDYTIILFPDGLCYVRVCYPLGHEMDSDWLEEVEEAKDWCQKQLARYLSQSLVEVTG